MGLDVDPFVMVLVSHLGTETTTAYQCYYLIRSVVYHNLVNLEDEKVPIGLLWVENQYLPPGKPTECEEEKEVLQVGSLL